ncbi:6-hydroxymethylpterin diphosphokinase MptE-like protein [Helicobacter pullorum]|uniref:motility associated factor glycosyltransferase family protein n=1 Tax=Helicobacter pullorum TaxID=35818 RepID=UPI0010670876|nr:6-hydroxymethylpterin diphosphokinase MptE-like protein [Helicobacter pullorum]
MGIVEFLKNSSCEEIEEFCARRFGENLQFFEANYPNLFSALQQPLKDYQLYIGKEGINIIETKTNSLMYPMHNGESTMLLVHENCAFNPPINEKWNRIYGTEMAMMNENFPYSSIMVNGVLEFLSQNGGITSYHLPSDFLPNISLFGLGGGIFLQILNEKYSAIHNFFIFEESLDLFRIACFFVDFGSLFQKVENKGGYIFIESMMKRDYVLNFFLSRRISTSVMRLELMMYQTPVNISARSIVYELHLQSLRGWGTYEDEMIGIKNKKNYPLYPMLVEPKRINAPICVIANGPSLDFLLPFIKKNQNKMILFSCGTALKPLLNAGIRPDFQIEIERHHYLGDVLKEAPLGDIPLLCATVLNKEAKELAKEIYLFERDGSSAANLNEPKFKVKFTAPLVGNAGASLASYLGSDVILCGLDCGYKKGAKKHAKNSYYGEEDEKLPEGVYKVDGNFSDDIYSDALYSLSRNALEEAFRALKPFNILNLNDGAYIKGATPIYFQDFELKEINKNQEIKNLKSLFKNPQECGFYTKETQLYIFEILAFKNSIRDLFNVEVQNKKGLFIAVDKIFEEISKVSQKNPFVGILFGGTLSHFLYHIALGSLHLPYDDMRSFWAKVVELYEDSMEKMIENLRKVILQ